MSAIAVAASKTVTVAAGGAVGSLTLTNTAGTFTMAGSSAITINSGISFGNPAGLTWTAPIIVGDNQIWSHGGSNSTAKNIQTGGTNLNGHSLTWNSTNTTANSGFAHRTITGNGSIVKNGTEWLTLAGTTAALENTYTGNTTISAGTLAINGAGSIT